MTKIKIKLFRILLIVLVVVPTYYFAAPNFLQNTTVQAIGDLTVNWGVPEGDPIFVVSNMAPGDEETRTVGIANTSAFTRPVGVRGVETSETNNLSQALEIVISEGLTDLYGGTAGTKTLDQFFTDSTGPDGIPLSTLLPSASTSYTFEVTFMETAGNDFQNGEVVFDLIIGISVDLPDECELLDLLATPIIGTAKAEKLTGTPGNDLIMGLNGADSIVGNGGNDCILGGSGAESIDAGPGNDVVFGEQNADYIRGNLGNDLLVGGEGGDTLKGEGGEDHLIGNQNSDNLDGGLDNDLLEGNEDPDTLKGQGGNDHLIGGLGVDYLDGGDNEDTLEGNENNDTLKGGNGNDNLVGGAGIDNANGQADSDTCDAETESNCEI